MCKVTYNHPVSGKQVSDKIVGIDGDHYIVDRMSAQSMNRLKVHMNDVLAVEDEETDEGFKGYYGIDENGDKFHTWDFEESIGE